MKKSEVPYGMQIKTIDTLLSANLSTESSLNVSINLIQLPKKQPRKYFDPQKLSQLAESIKEFGVLDPLLVRSLPDGNYELVAGERRLRASKLAGLKEIPIVVRELDDKQAARIALIENLQREDLNPVEETEWILDLLAQELEKSQVEVTALLHRMLDEKKEKVPHNVMGKSESEAVQQVFQEMALMDWTSFVQNRLPLLKLPEDVSAALREGRIAYTKAQAIARVKDSSERSELLEEAISQDLSLTQIKDKIKAIKTETSKDSNEITVVQQLDEAYRLVRKAKVWADPKKKKKLEKLIVDLNSLVDQWK